MRRPRACPADSRPVCKKELGRGMVELPGPHGTDHRQLIGDGSEMGQEFRHPGAALAMLPEGIGRTEKLGMTAQETEAFALKERFGRELAIALLEFRFVVEQIQLGRRAYQMKEDDMLGAGREMGPAGLAKRSGVSNPLRAMAPMPNPVPEERRGDAVDSSVDGFVKVEQDRGDIERSFASRSLVISRAQLTDLRCRGMPAKHGAKRAFEIAGKFLVDASGESLRHFDISTVVHQCEGLQRGIALGTLDGADAALRGIEDREVCIVSIALPDRVDPAPVGVLSGGDGITSGPAPAAISPDTVRLIGIDGRPHFGGEQAAHEEAIVADRFGVEPMARVSPKPLVQTDRTPSLRAGATELCR